VVDDEIGIREAEGEILERFGYRVVWAEDAETAVSIYRRQWEAIDLVILDLNMPGMGGLQCLKELLARQDHYCKRLRRGKPPGKGAGRRRLRLYQQAVPG
jgi:DNA-binding response OmpR family regulator